MKKKWIKYTVSILLAVIVAWILFLGVAFFYIKTHKQKIISAIKADIKQKDIG